MKITFDTETKQVRVDRKLYDEAPKYKKELTESALRKFLIDNTKLSDYEEDCMWMSYRYCVGRHTIASHMHAKDIWENCKGRMSDERQLFTAYDINREVEECLVCMKPSFYFPITSLNRIYETAVDIVCQFMEDYKIDSPEDFIEYKDVHVILTDNERGYKFETVTWEEYLRPRVRDIVANYYGNDAMSEDFAWKYFEAWKKGDKMPQKEIVKGFEEITRGMPDPEHFYMSDFEDLFVWNNLVHCFDYEHHHKSILTDDTECEWFWSWTNKTEQHDDGLFYRKFGYERIRIPVGKWNSFIPDESIKEDLY